MATSPRRTRRILLMAAAGVLLILGGVWGYSSWFGQDQESPTGLPEELRYESLKAKADEPEKLFETVRETRRREDLTEEQHREVRDNIRKVMEAELDERMDEYFAAAPDQRDAVLDGHIDEFRERMGRWRERREQERAEGEGDREGEDERRAESRRERRHGRFGDMSREERKTRSESRDPDQTARRMAYFTAIRARMEARGIEMPRHGPGRGRGGPPHPR